jgi:hypothetical protein
LLLSLFKKIPLFYENLIQHRNGNTIWYSLRIFPEQGISRINVFAGKRLVKDLLGKFFLKKSIGLC